MTQSYEDKLFAEELNTEAKFFDTFSTIKLNISTSFGSERIINVLTGLLAEHGPRFYEDWRPILAIVHECTHFWHWIGTTLGFHTTRLTMAQSVLTRLCMKILDKHGFELFPIPLKALPLERVSKEAREEINRVINIWNCIEDYKRILHGHRIDFLFDSQQFASDILPTAYNALLRFDCAQYQFGDESSTDYAKVEDMLANYAFHLTPSREMTPRIPWSEGIEFNLSGRVILEGAASFQEAKIFKHLNDLGIVSDNDFLERANIIGNSFYSITASLVYEHLPRRQETVFCLPYLYDLALMGLLDPLYSEPFTDEIVWIDIHPGWRFLKILQTVKEIGIPLPNAPIDAYYELIETICERNRWPTPKELANSSKRFAPKEKDLHEWAGPGFINLNPFFEFRRRHCAAMEARLRNPELFINTSEHFAELFGRDPEEYNLLRPNIVMSDGTAFPDTEMISFFMFHYIMRQIFTGSIDGLNPEHVLPKGLKLRFQSHEGGPIFENGDLYELFIWKKVEFPKERLISIDQW